MAFQTAAASTPANNTQNNEGWKAQGFINLYLPARNGQRRKLGAIPLKANRSNEKELLDWLNEDPSRVLALLPKLELEYQPAQQASETGFDLG